MSEMKVFDNQEFGEVRTVIIDGEPWFVGKDIAGALGYSNHRDAINKHVDNEDRGESQIATSSGEQTMIIINESGMYALVFGSKMENMDRRVYPHLFRKTTATNTCKRGGSVDAAGEYLGHAPRNVTDRHYTYRGEKYVEQIFHNFVEAV